jgi:nucleoside-diphosphate-sugar epimerase
VLRQFLDAALTGAPLRYYGTGARTQDFIHVDDVAAAIARAARDRVSGLFVLASGQSITMRDLAGLIVEATGSSSPVEAAGVPDPEEGRVVRYRVDAMRARLAAPETPLAEGVRVWAATRRAELAAGAAP